jgi:hypothetical protein
LHKVLIISELFVADFTLVWPPSTEWNWSGRICDQNHWNRWTFCCKCHTCRVCYEVEPSNFSLQILQLYGFTPNSSLKIWHVYGLLRHAVWRVHLYGPSPLWSRVCDNKPLEPFVASITLVDLANSNGFSRLWCRMCIQWTFYCICYTRSAFLSFAVAVVFRGIINTLFFTINVEFITGDFFFQLYTCLVFLHYEVVDMCDLKPSVMTNGELFVVKLYTRRGFHGYTLGVCLQRKELVNFCCRL